MRRYKFIRDEKYPIARKAEPYKQNDYIGIEHFDTYYDSNENAIVTNLNVSATKTIKIQDYLDMFTDKEICDKLNELAQRDGQGLCQCTVYMYKNDLEEHPQIKEFFLQLMGEERFNRLPETYFFGLDAENMAHQITSKSAKDFLIAEGVYDNDFYMPIFIKACEEDR